MLLSAQICTHAHKAAWPLAELPRPSNSLWRMLRCRACRARMHQPDMYNWTGDRTMVQQCACATIRSGVVRGCLATVSPCVACLYAFHCNCKRASLSAHTQTPGLGAASSHEPTRIGVPMCAIPNTHAGSINSSRPLVQVCQPNRLSTKLCQCRPVGDPGNSRCARVPMAADTETTQQREAAAVSWQACTNTCNGWCYGMRTRCRSPAHCCLLPVLHSSSFQHGSTSCPPPYKIRSLPSPTAAASPPHMYWSIPEGQRCWDRVADLSVSLVP